uniref:CBFD_NFYB_HMF domain-containing protein n=1 Tax=Rhabditophanes sp. KR3021 TaxID=114890 RepID=A0AC35U496_9BILA
MEDSGNRTFLNDLNCSEPELENYKEDDNDKGEDLDTSDNESDVDSNEDLDDDMQYDGLIPDQIRFLPIANISRVMKRVIPRNAKLSKEARECVQECVSEFISFISSEASEQCHNQKRKTITSEDIINAFNCLDMIKYGTILTEFLNKCKETHNTCGSVVKQTNNGNYFSGVETDSIFENIRLKHRNENQIAIKKFDSVMTEDWDQNCSTSSEIQRDNYQIQSQKALLNQSSVHQQKNYSMNHAQSNLSSNQFPIQNIQPNMKNMNDTILHHSQNFLNTHSLKRPSAVILSPQREHMTIINDVHQQVPGNTNHPMSSLTSDPISKVVDSMHNDRLSANLNAANQHETAGELVPCEIMIDTNSGNYFLVAQSFNGETNCIPIDKDSLSKYGISPFIK